MDINSLKCFIAVAEEQNITKAAKRLFITQQTLSSIIQRLEAECQAPLLERKPSLRLTRAGEIMLTYARKIVNSENDLFGALADIDRNCSATLRVGIAAVRGDRFFYPIWEQFHEKHPNIAVSLYSGRTEEFYRLLSLGEISLFLGVNTGQRNGYVSRTVAEEQLACVFSLRFLKQFYPSLTEEDMYRFLEEGIAPEMLQGLPCVRQRPDTGRGAFGLENMLYNAGVESDHQSALVSLIRNGVGYGFVFPYVFMDRVNNPGGDLWMVPVKKELNPFRVSIVYRDQPMPTYQEDFIAVVENVMAKYQEYAAHFYSRK